MPDANKILEISNYYRVLGTNSNASDELIKQRYLERVREFPPERSPQAFKKIREAYDTLKDPFKRSEYDLNNKYQGKPKRLLDDASFCMMIGSYDEAESLLNEAEQLAADNLHILRVKAKFALLQNNYGQFKKTFREIEEIAPKSKQFIVLLNKADLLLEEEYVKQALKVIKEIETLFPNKNSQIQDLYISAYDRQENFNKIWDVLSDRLRNLKDLNQDFDIFILALALIGKYSKWDKKDYLLKYTASFIEQIKENQEFKGSIIELLEGKIEEGDLYADVEMQLFLIDILLEFTDDDSMLSKKKKLNKVEKLMKEIKMLSFNENISPFIFYRATKLYFEWAYPDDDPELHIDFPSIFEMKEFEKEHRWNINAIDYLKNGNFTIYEVFEDEWIKLRENSYNSLSEKELLLFNNQLNTGQDSDYKKLRSGQIVNQKKVARNDPCPCGSGKKYKKCCL